MKLYVLLSEYQHSQVFERITNSLDEAVEWAQQEYCWVEDWDTDNLKEERHRSWYQRGGKIVEMP